MIRRILKALDSVKVLDSLKIFGSKPSKRAGGLRMQDGSSVPVEVIMVQFGVDKDRALDIQKQVTQ